MTNEEARNYLLKWIEYATNPEAHPFIDEPCSDEEILEAMRIVAEALSNTELPSNLDEAANEYFEQYNYMPKGFVVDAFKSGAKWMAGQFQKIEGELVDWYETNCVEYCNGISTNESFEVPEGFYIRKK